MSPWSDKMTSKQDFKDNKAKGDTESNVSKKDNRHMIRDIRSEIIVLMTN